MLFPALTDPTDKVALRFGDRALTYRQLRGAATAVAQQLEGRQRVAVWAVNEPEIAVAVVGALLAGVPIVPINPKAGERELEHILADCAPGAACSARPAPTCRTRSPRAAVDVDLEATGGELARGADDEAPAIVVYTSGTTGPPKGVVLPRRAIASNLDALADAWEWTGEDVVAHGLPLFHVHGLILGMLGPLRLGGGVAPPRALLAPSAPRRRSPDGATMLFGVPTMYHRLAADAEARRADRRRALGGARLLVSGSAALPAADHERIERLTGQRIVERYGMTETLMNTGVRARRRAPAGLRRPAARRASSCGSSTTTATALDGRRRRDGRRDPGPRARTCSSSTSTGPTRPPRRWPTAGSAPATSPPARRTATSGSSAAARPT